MMPLDKQQLIEIAERYYRRINDPSDPNYENSSEVKAYDEAWERAPSFEKWFETVDAIRKDLPGLSTHDATPGRSCGAFRCVAHLKDQPLAAGAELRTVIAGYRSVLAPVYGVVWAQQVKVPGPVSRTCAWQGASVEIPEELAPVTEVMARHIERESGFQRLSPELARARVPNIYVHFIPFGEATLFDALLDPNASNFY
jgi:hypothetical protein